MFVESNEQMDSSTRPRPVTDRGDVYNACMSDEPFCHCRGEHCKHHAELEPCPNKPIPPISSIIDMQTGTPVAGSATGLCEECWENHMAQAEQE
jgi:hypothetical protein